MDRAQKKITDLSEQMVGLENILANKQARGAFGEIQLHDLVESIMPPGAFAFQATLTNGKRADCLLKLPNPPGPIAIDARTRRTSGSGTRRRAGSVPTCSSMCAISGRNI